MKIKRLLFLFSLPLLLAACTSYKNVPYLQNPEAVNDLEGTLPLYDAKIMPKDLLSITVNTSDPQAAAPFNLTMQTSINVAQANSTYVTSQPTLQQYLVNNEGEIDFPVIGKLKIGGLTKTAAEKLIREQLRPYLKETPIVTVRMSNYKISVIGEVNRPGTFTINNEKVNLFEALAMAGDMTVYGIRSNVKLIREDNNGQRNIISLNLNEQNILHSPYYYLQQNDILYVESGKAAMRSAKMGNITPWVSVLSVLVSLASLGVVLFNK